MILVFKKNTYRAVSKCLQSVTHIALLRGGKYFHSYFIDEEMRVSLQYREYTRIAMVL